VFTSSLVFKAREDDLTAIRDFVKRIENSFLRAFLTYLQKMASDDLVAEIARLIAAERQADIPVYLDQFAVSFQGTVFDAVIAAARFETDMIAPDLARVVQQAFPNGGPVVGISFNPGNPRAAELVNQQASRLVREINESTRAVVTEALIEGQNEGFGARKTAQRIKENLGLTERQLAAVRNYRRLLEEGSSEALNRDLRDKRFDKTIANAKKKPLSADQIDKMVMRYKEKFIQYRAQVIARTEAAEAVNNGRTEALRQQLENTGLGDNAVIKTWISTKDKRVRRSHGHSGLDGKSVRGIDALFVSPLTGAKLKAPGDRSHGAPASECVNCRCTFLNKIVLEN